MYHIHETNCIISKPNGLGRYCINHHLADVSNAKWKRVKQSIINGIKIATATIGTVAILMLASGCASRQHIHELHTSDTVSQRYAISETVTTKSRSVSMALSVATHRCRVRLAQRLNTEMLYGSHVVYQNIQTDGLYYTATVTVAMPQ